MRCVLVPHNRVCAPDECVTGAGRTCRRSSSGPSEIRLVFCRAFQSSFFFRRTVWTLLNRAHRQFSFLVIHKNYHSFSSIGVVLGPYACYSPAPKVPQRTRIFRVGPKNLINLFGRRENLI